MYGPLEVGHSIPILGSLYDRNQAKQLTDPSIQGHEASLESTAVGVHTPDSKVHDHSAVDRPGSGQWHVITCTGGQWSHEVIRG